MSGTSVSSVLAELVPSFLLGLGLLATCLFTFTYENGVRFWPRYARIALAPFALYSFWDFGFAHFASAENALESQAYCGIVSISLYFIVRVLGACVLNVSDPKPPVWVSRRTRKPLPLPRDLIGRLRYSFDLLSSMRGCSTVRGVYWDFAPVHIANYVSPSMSRTTFILHGIFQIIILVSIAAFSDWHVRSIEFDTTHTYPVTALLPFKLQLLCVYNLFIGIYFSVHLEAKLIAIICVGLGLTPDLSASPPMFDSPLLSPSLPEFWGKGWHASFRTSFLTLSFSRQVKPDSGGDGKSGSKAGTARLARVVWTFFLSGLMHAIIMQRPPADAKHPHPGFLELSVFSFFLAQPVGILLDAGIVRLGGGTFWRRAFAWAWLIWTARWWCDSWVKKGMWDGAPLVDFDALRSFLVRE